MFFLNNDLLEILEDIEPSIRTQKEAYYCQIALVHLLAGYPNDHEKTCKENVNINYFMYLLEKPIQKYKEKYHL